MANDYGGVNYWIKAANLLALSPCAIYQFFDQLPR